MVKTIRDQLNSKFGTNELDQWNYSNQAWFRENYKLELEEEGKNYSLRMYNTETSGLVESLGGSISIDNLEKEFESFIRDINSKYFFN